MSIHHNLVCRFLIVFFIQFFIATFAFAAASLNSQPAHDQRVGTLYSQTNVASGGSGSYTFSVFAGTLPAGVTLNPSTGTASGTPTAVQSYSYSIRVNDGLTTVTNTVSGSISAPSLNMQPDNFSNPQRGVFYSQTILPNGGTAPYTFAVSAGSLLTGVTLNATTGVFSGVPNTLGTFNFTFRATDSTTGTGAPYSFTRGYNVTVFTGPSLSLSSSTSSTTQVGVAYAQSNVGSGGTGTYTYAISAGAMPAGLTLNTSTGRVSGTPTAAGAFSYSVRVNDGSNTATQVISGTMAAPSIAINPNLPSGTVGSLYSQTLTGSGGTAPYVFAISAGVVPPGLSLNTATGELTGTSTTANTFNFTIRTTDSSTGTAAPFSNTRVYAVVIANPPLFLNAMSSGATQIGVAYSQVNTGSGGSGSYTYSVSAGALPAGLTVNAATGTVSGTPSAAGAFSYTIQVSDGLAVQTQIISGTIAAPSIVINPSLPSGTIGTLYSQTILATGGTAPYVYAVASGTLPNGLTLNTAIGTITGTPTAATTFNFTIRAIDSSTGTAAPFSNTRAYVLTIANPPLLLAVNSSSNAQVGVAYLLTSTASGGTGSYTYSISAGALPAGTSLDASTGTVSGTPTAAGPFTYAVQVSDGLTAATQVLARTMLAPTITINPTTVLQPQVGVAYSQTLSGSGGTAPYTFAVSGGALSAGLSLNTSTGVITGTPTTAGPYSLTIQVTDSSSGTGSPFTQTRTFSGTVLNAVLRLTSSVSASSQIGNFYSQANTASGGTGAYAYSVSGGALPIGVLLNASTGGVSGTPTAAGAFSYTILVSDGAFTATQVLSGTIAAPSIVINPSLPSGTVGVAYGQTIVASGGTAPYTYTVSAGALPGGLTLNASSGILTGTPNTSNTFNFTIQATDSSTGTGAPFSNTRAYSVPIANADLVLNVSSSTNAQVGVAYSLTSTVSGGTGSYTFSISAGALPAGLVLNTATGSVSGTATAAGPFTYTIQVSDGLTTATQVLVRTMAAPTITINRTTLTVPQVGVFASDQLVAQGGTAPYNFIVTAGGILGVDMTTGGLVSGTPTTAGPFTVTIQVTDSSTGTGAPFSQTQIFTGNVINANLVLDSNSAAITEIGELYSQINIASGGSGSYTYSVIAGVVPAGLALNTATGTVSGTPTAAGAFSYTIQVSDGLVTTAQTISGTIVAPSIVINPSLPSGTVGITYSQTIVASDGIAPYVYAVSAGTLPTGLNLNFATGDITGTPTTAATYSFTIRATDSSTGTGAPFSNTRIYDVTIANPALLLSTGISTATQIGVAYAQTNVASGGTGSYVYAVSAGALPAGLALNTLTGTVSGTPTGAGAFSYTVQVSDGAGTTTTVTSGSIDVPTLTVNPITLQQPATTLAYSQAITTTGGTAPYSYAVSTGALPAGLTLNTATGDITGTPTTATTYNFTISSTDSSTGTGAPFSQSRAYAVTVIATVPPLSISPTASNVTQIGVGYTQDNVASGGTGSYTYSMSAGTLPAGLSLNVSTGTVSGTPSEAGVFSYTIEVSDGSTTATQATSGTIAAPNLVINRTTLQELKVGVPFSETILGSGGTAPYTFAGVAGVIDGLSLNTTTNVVSGTPTTAGPYSVTVQVTDSSTGTGAPFAQTQVFTGTVLNADLVLSVNSSTNAQVGVPYVLTSTASGGTGSYTYSISAGALPAGVSLNTSTGTVSGTPTAAGAFTYTVEVSDGVVTASQVLTRTMAAPVIVNAPITLQIPQVGVPFSASNPASGGTAPYIYTVTAGALTAGLTLDASNGSVSGTPTVAGPFSVTIQVTDSSTGTGAPFSNAQTFSGTVLNATLLLGSNVSTHTQINDPYLQTNVASGGTGSYAYAVSAGALPTGTALDFGTGTVSGTPTAAGAFSYTIEVNDGAFTATQILSGTIAAPSIVINPSLPSGTIGAAYSQTIVASGGTAPFTYAVSTGTLPGGLTLDASSGGIGGTPTTSNTFNFTIQATDSSTGTGAPFSSTRAYSVVIANATLVLNVNGSTNLQVGTAYGLTAAASGGTGSYTYVISAGALPAGLVLDTLTGTVSGTPTEAGSFTYTLQVSDGVTTATQVLVGTMAEPTITIGRTVLPVFQVGVPISEALFISGGTAPYTIGLDPAAVFVPIQGVTANPTTGVFSGTPTAAGPYSITIQVTDSSTGTGAPFTNTRTFSGTVINANLVLSANPSTAAEIGESYTQANTASGGTGTYTYSISAGALPAGLSLDAATGIVTGTPTAAGAYSYTIQVSDGATTATQALSGTILAPTIVINPSLPSGTVGIAYNQTILASGGIVPYEYAVSAGTLPAGLSLNTATGDISGTPTTATSYSFTIEATDSSTGTGAPFFNTRVYAVVIANPSLTLNATTATSTRIGTLYFQTNTASGGTGTYTYSVSAGALSAGLVLDVSSGIVSGTPTAAGAFSYTIQVSDGATTATQVLAGIIAAPVITNGLITLPVLRVGLAFNVADPAVGGTAPYTYSIVAGALTPGLSLNAADGTVSGTPTVAGPFSVTIRATDSSTGTGAPFSNTQVFSGTVLDATLVLSSATSNPTAIGAPYSQANVASGGTGSYMYSVSAGALPAGVSLDSATGTVSGTPTSAGPFSYTIQASDGATIVTQVVTGIMAAPTITINPTLPSGTVGIVYSRTIIASGGTAPYAYAISAGALPTGLSFDTASGLISGTPTTAATYNFTIRATDAGLFTNTRVYSIVINSSTLVASSFSIAVLYNSQGQAIPLAAHTNEPITSATLLLLPTHGSATLSGTVVTYIPTRGFVGADSFTFTASNTGGTSLPATASITVADRPDPSLDVDVRGLIAAQTEAVQRYADSQVSNVANRLQNLHHSTALLENGIRFNFGDCASAPTSGFMGHAMSSSFTPIHAIGPDDECAARTAMFSQLQQSLNSLLTTALVGSDNATGVNRDLSIWTAGTINFGSVAGQDRNFTSSGLTIGIDKRLSDEWVFGVAAGYGMDDSNIGSDGTHVTNHNVSGSVYGSYQPFKMLFIDAMAGFGQTSFTTRRFIPSDNLFVTGDRSGKEWFGSLSVSSEISAENFSFAPYARLDMLHATLDGFTETGSDVWALRYDRAQINSLTAVAGLRGAYDIPQSWGMLTPSLSVEYRHLTNAAGIQNLGYADVVEGTSYGVAQTNLAADSFIGSIGLRAQTDSGWIANLEYGASLSGAGLQSQQIRVLITVPF